MDYAEPLRCHISKEREGKAYVLLLQNPVSFSDFGLRLHGAWPCVHVEQTSWRKSRSREDRLDRVLVFYSGT